MKMQKAADHGLGASSNLLEAHAMHPLFAFICHIEMLLLSLGRMAERQRQDHNNVVDMHLE